MKIPLNKTHEGCEVLIQQDKSRLLYYIESVDEESQTVCYRHAGWEFSIADSRGYSKNVCYAACSNWFVIELKARYDKPINFFTELKICVIEFMHKLLGNIGFNMNR